MIGAVMNHYHSERSDGNTLLCMTVRPSVF